MYIHTIQKGFVEKGAVQCGLCTPELIMCSKALLDRNPNPSEEEIRFAIAETSAVEVAVLKLSKQFSLWRKCNKGE